MKHLIKILTVEELNIFEMAVVLHQPVALIVLKNTPMKLVADEGEEMSFMAVMITPILTYKKKTKNYAKNCQKLKINYPKY